MSNNDRVKIMTQKTASHILHRARSYTKANEYPNQMSKYAVMQTQQEKYPLCKICQKPITLGEKYLIKTRKNTCRVRHLSCFEKSQQ